MSCLIAEPGQDRKPCLARLPPPLGGGGISAFGGVALHMRIGQCVLRASFALLLVWAMGSAPVMAQDVTSSIRGAITKQPLPRFVSLKSNKVNARGGPTRDHDVAWIYQRSGLPVEITAEFDNWRRIRDWDGSESWVFHSMLSAKRTAIVRAGQSETMVPLYDKAGRDAGLAAKLEPRVTANIKTCNGQWCRIQGSNFDGWIEQNKLWGVYPGEKVE
jgi:SH3-like domain-containing protein